ncbi:MAG: uncharacterized protein JWL84_6239 [Rhodospirillales bacterium]|jgi:uncharacterized protein (DUF2141 family)|nr:uncharacterized protein [Rhodospirillales bacterium]
MTPSVAGCTVRPKSQLGDRRTLSSRLLRGFAAIVSLALISAPASALDLKVVITGVRSSEGSVLIGLYDSEEHFRTAIENSAKVGLLNDRARLVGVSMRAIVGMQSAVFTNLQPGTYVVIVFHDEDDNGKLDTNFFGVPTEGYGFSNNAEGFLAPPSFKDAAVTLDQADRTIEINLDYRIPAAQWLSASPDGDSSAGPDAARPTPQDK